MVEETLEESNRIFLSAKVKTIIRLFFLLKNFLLNLLKKLFGRIEPKFELLIIHGALIGFHGE